MLHSDFDSKLSESLVERYKKCIMDANAFAYASKSLIEEASIIKNLLELKGVNLDRAFIEANENQLDIASKPAIEKQGRKTFEDIIVSILQDGNPRTTKMLHSEYIAVSGKELSQKDFSSNLSMRATNGTKLKKMKFPDYPIEDRYWWGLSEWFDGINFKSEYIEKVMEEMLF